MCPGQSCSLANSCIRQWTWNMTAALLPRRYGFDFIDSTREAAARGKRRNVSAPVALASLRSSYLRRGECKGSCAQPVKQIRFS